VRLARRYFHFEFVVRKVVGILARPSCVMRVFPEKARKYFVLIKFIIQFAFAFAITGESIEAVEGHAVLCEDFVFENGGGRVDLGSNLAVA